MPARTTIGLALMLALLLRSVVATAEPEAQPPRFVAYHETWSEIAPADPGETRLARLPAYLDVVMLAFARPDLRYRGDFDLRDTGLGFPFDGRFAREAVAALRRRQPDLRVLLSVGGATYHGWDTLNATGIARLVADLGLDGVDVDFEPRFPACRTDGQGMVRCASDAPFIAAVAALRKVLPRPRLLAVAGWSVGAFGEGDWRDAQPSSRYTGMALALLRAPVAREIDLLSVMAYDTRGRLDPMEAYRAYRAVYDGPLVLGVAVQDALALPVAERLGAVERLAGSLRRDGAPVPSGIMVYSLQMTSPHDRPGGRFAAALVATVCRGLGKAGCDAVLP